MIRLDKRELGTLTPLGTGGMAQVYRVGGSVAQLPGDLAFKELKPTVVDPVRSQLLNMMRLAVEIREKMSPQEQTELDSLAVWPLAMVHDKGQEVGLLMPCLPDDFFIDALAAGQPTKRVFEFQLLSADPDQAKRNGFDKSREPADNDLVRLALMARLAYAIEVIHRPRNGQRLVYGDLSLRNAAVATTPPRILLMDCDGVADITDTTRTQPNTPFFQPPELTPTHKLQDQLTDVYKLGLCVIRGLARGRGATQLKDPTSPLIPAGLLDPTGIDLLNRAVSPDRTRRPTAEDIKDYLIGRVLDLAHPPTLVSAQLNNDAVRRGFEVRVLWDHKAGKKVRIFDDLGVIHVQNLDANGYANGYPVKPQHSCEILVAVSNDHGEDVGSAGHVAVYDVPEPRVLYNVRSVAVSVPDVPSVEIPRTKAELPPYPMYPTRVVPVPSLSWPVVPAMTVENIVPPPQEVPTVVTHRLASTRAFRDAVDHAFHVAGAGINQLVGDIVRRQRRRAAQRAATNPPPGP